MVRNKHQRLYPTSLTCTKCGLVQTIQRKYAKRKKVGHIKPLWCIRCKKRTRHVEQE